MPEQIWVWPLHPLKYLNNRQVPECDVEAGQTIDLTIGREPATSNLFTGKVFTWHTVWCRYYRPTAADLADIKRHYPDGEPGNPSWPRIEADLIANEHDHGKLVKLNAPTLLRLLERVPGQERSASDAGGLSVKDENTEAPTCSVAALREMTGLKNTALNRYAKKANVKTPQQGEKNFQYPAADVRAILEAIIASTAEDALRGKCSNALRHLPEITE